VLRIFAQIGCFFDPKMGWGYFIDKLLFVTSFVASKIGYFANFGVILFERSTSFDLRVDLRFTGKSGYVDRSNNNILVILPHGYIAGKYSLLGLRLSPPKIKSECRLSSFLSKVLSSPFNRDLT
jgi:hypothetical protein